MAEISSFKDSEFWDFTVDCYAMFTEGNFFVVLKSKKETSELVSWSCETEDSPTIKESASSNDKSWIGQKVTLTCVSDGVPTPQLTWYKPAGSQINRVKAKQNTVNVTMNVTQDFGVYKCDANNGISPNDSKIVKIKQITSPGSPAITQLDTQSTSVTVKWSAPTNDGGIPITAYRVVLLKGSTEISNTNITDPCTTRFSTENLLRDTEYTLKVFARNAVFEGPAVEEVVKTKYEESGIFRENACDERTLHITYIIVILMLLMILIFIIIQWRLRNGAATSSTNRRKKCAERGGEFVVLNPISVKPDQQSSSNRASSDSKTYAAPSREDYFPLHPSGRTWEINREQVKIIKVLGKGAFSRVAKATAWNISGKEENTTVAVKMLKANAPESDRRDLLSELELMKKLKPHPHVIKLLGCVTATDPLLVLIEYVPYGDLLGYLRKSRGLNDTYFKDPDVKPQTSLTAEQLIRFAWQVADGMLYLSSRKIIHRDLAARNVLVGEGEKCKVTDFGMARNVQQDDIYSQQSRGRLPVKWTAYEALLYGTYTTQSDVWSYGVLLYEILTVGGSPYPGINARQIARKLKDGFRMPKPKHVDNKLYQIMLKCWEENPSDRPTFAKLKTTMKEMERNHKTYVNLKQYNKSLYRANVEDLTAE